MPIFEKRGGDHTQYGRESAKNLLERMNGASKPPRRSSKNGPANKDFGKIQRYEPRIGHERRSGISIKLIFVLGLLGYGATQLKFSTGDLTPRSADVVASDGPGLTGLDLGNCVKMDGYIDCSGAGKTQVDKEEIAQNVDENVQPTQNIEIDSENAIGIKWLPKSITRYEDLIIEAGKEYGVDPKLIAIVIIAESGGFEEALSEAGATGLMQLMRPTFESIAKKKGLDSTTLDIWDPETNIKFGSFLLAELSNAYSGNIALVAPAFNAGQPVVDQYEKGMIELPPEAISYQKWIVGMYEEKDLATSTTFNQWRLADENGKNLLLQASEGDR